MDKITDMSPIQLIITGVFIFFIVVGMGFLAFGTISSDKANKVNVVVWGTMPNRYFVAIRSTFAIENLETVRDITYIQKDPVTYENELIDAFASGTGPDVFFLPHDLLLEHRNKIFTIPYENYPLRTYTDTFIKESELFVGDEGVYAVPFMVDPMIMYWNTTLFSNAGIARPPQYWDELFDLVPLLTVVDPDLNISQSAFALGEFDNVTHSKEIISALLLQNDIPISKPVSSSYQSSFIPRSAGGTIRESWGVLNYYTQFANSTNSFYTWNRSLPRSDDYFTSTDLAIYFGFASELETLKEKNPNMQFDVASLPQTRAGFERVTYGHLTGLAIPNISKNKGPAFEVIKVLTTRDSMEALSAISDLPAVRPDAMERTPDNPYMPVFQESALWSRAWLEPTPEEGSRVFRGIINDITSGRMGVGEALSKGSNVINEAYRQLNL